MRLASTSVCSRSTSASDSRRSSMRSRPVTFRSTFVGRILNVDVSSLLIEARAAIVVRSRIQEIEGFRNRSNRFGSRPAGQRRRERAKERDAHLRRHAVIIRVSLEESDAIAMLPHEFDCVSMNEREAQVACVGSLDRRGELAARKSA
jgi:hypothetical protein